MKHRLLVGFSMLSLVLAGPVAAADAVPAQVQAIVWVACGNRQGTGTVINGKDGYVLTNAHVAIDIQTSIPADSCVVGFIDKFDQPPVYIYQATVERYVFDQSRNQDFAILKIGARMSREGLTLPFPFLKTNEFPAVGQDIRIFGFSDHTTQALSERIGRITGFRGGWIQTDAPIRSGDSGGASIDANDSLIGLPTATVTITSGTQVLGQTSQLVDVRAVLNWLDTAGKNEHDKYVTHLDYPRYHSAAIVQAQDDLGCDDLVRTVYDPAVYCLLFGSRYVFPNAATYFSWFKDFSTVQLIDLPDLATFPIKRNVTLKPGSLVKSASAPDVYVVIDAYGDLRGVPTEAKAETLWGPGWAKLVHDIPDEFFGDYSIGQPLETDSL